MKKYGVVIRHLPGCRPVAMEVIEANSEDYDDVEHYINSVAQDVIQGFTSKFVEFRFADFYIDIL